MFMNMLKRRKAKKNQQVILKETWEFKELFEEMTKINVNTSSIEALLKELYEYVYVQVFLNKQPLHHIFFAIEHKKVWHRHSRDSYWDAHTITIEWDSFRYEFRYRFDKMPRWNLAGDNAVCLNKDALHYVQIFLKKEHLPLLHETHVLKNAFSFKEDVPVEVQEKVLGVFPMVRKLKEDAWCLHRENMAKVHEKKQQQDKKRKEILGNY